MSTHKKWLDSKVQHLIYQKPTSSNIRENEIIENPNTIRFLNGENYAMYIMAGFFVFIIIIDLFAGHDSFDKESFVFYGVFFFNCINIMPIWLYPSKKGIHL